MISRRTENSGWHFGNPTFSLKAAALIYFFLSQPQECARPELYLGLHGVSLRPCLYFSWNSGVECHLRRFTCFVSGFYLLTEALDDPVNRTAALLSLICALISLIYGCMYNVKFGVTRNMFHASRWAHIAKEHLSLHNAAKVHLHGHALNHTSLYILEQV